MNPAQGNAAAQADYPLGPVRPAPSRPWRTNAQYGTQRQGQPSLNAPDANAPYGTISKRSGRRDRGGKRKRRDHNGKSDQGPQLGQKDAKETPGQTSARLKELPKVQLRTLMDKSEAEACFSAGKTNDIKTLKDMYATITMFAVAIEAVTSEEWTEERKLYAFKIEEAFIESFNARNPQMTADMRNIFKIRKNEMLKIVRAFISQCQQLGVDIINEMEKMLVDERVVRQQGQMPHFKTFDENAPRDLIKNVVDQVNQICNRAREKLLDFSTITQKTLNKELQSAVADVTRRFSRLPDESRKALDHLRNIQIDALHRPYRLPVVKFKPATGTLYKTRTEVTSALLSSKMDVQKPSISSHQASGHSTSTRDTPSLGRIDLKRKRASVTVQAAQDGQDDGDTARIPLSSLKDRVTKKVAFKKTTVE